MIDPPNPQSSQAAHHSGSTIFLSLMSMSLLYWGELCTGSSTQGVSHQTRAEVKDDLPRHAVSALLIGLLCHKDAFLAPDHSIQSSFPISHSEAVLMPEIILSQRQNLALFFVELHKVSVRPFSSLSKSL